MAARQRSSTSVAGWWLATPTRGSLRLLRGGMVGVTSVVLALTGHVAAGGVAPDPGVTVLAGVIAVTVALRLSGRQWSLPALITLLSVTQAAFHAVFLTSSANITPTEPTGLLGSAMAAAHALAAVGLALLLRYADKLCWAVADLLGVGLSRLAKTTGASPFAAARPVGTRLDRDIEPYGLELARHIFRRGPPCQRIGIC